MEALEYLCIVVRPQSHSALALPDGDLYRLPHVKAQRTSRQARELQKAFKIHWGLSIMVLETWLGLDSFRAYAVAELLSFEGNGIFVEVPIDRLICSDISEDHPSQIELFLEGKLKSTISKFGWVQEAIAWMETATGRRFYPSSDVEQWSMGRGSALLRARSLDGKVYWLKAAGATNANEFALTRLMSEFYPASLPELVATRGDWNAWLTEHAGDPLQDPPNASELVSAANTLAKLQLKSSDQTKDFLAAGALDLRLPALKRHVDAVIAFLIAAMPRQTSTKVAPLSADRLLEIGEILRETCARQEELNIPDALIHNDLNPGNILWDGTRCVFTDWCEVAIGNPFLSCERLCRLNRAHEESVRNVYRHCWSKRLSRECINEAIVLSSLLAIYACLYGRGEWLNDIEEVGPDFESYARSLARHMDRAARDPILMERLCR